MLRAMATASTRVSALPDLERWLRPVGKVAFVGALTGFLIGGVGGRLAMLLLRVTSDDALHGLPTDDGFTIGVISTDTLFLLGITTFLGLVGALAYAVARSWFPPTWRVWVSTVFFGLVLGANVVRADGIDFRLLSPLWLAIALFVAIAAVYGFAMAWGVERWLASDHVPRSRWIALLPLVAFLSGGPFGVLLLIVLVVGWAAARAVPPVAELWWSKPVTWVGRGLVAVVAVSGAIELVNDTREILA